MHLLSKGAWKLEGRATLDPPALMPIWCHACMCIANTYGSQEYFSTHFHGLPHSFKENGAAQSLHRAGAPSNLLAIS